MASKSLGSRGAAANLSRDTSISDLRTPGSIKQIFVIQPFVIMYVIGSQMTAPALDNLELEKSCANNLHFNSNICCEILKMNGLRSGENIETQKVIVEMYAWQKSSENVIPFFMTLYLNSNRNQHKFKKEFLLLPIVGEMVSIIACDLYVHFEKWPVQVLGVFRTILPSLFGGQTTFFIALSLYISENCDFSTQSVRIATVSVLTLLTIGICHSFSGILFAKIGYTYILAIALLLTAFSLICGLILITERTTLRMRQNDSACNPKRLLYNFSVMVAKKRLNRRRLIAMVVLISFLGAGGAAGEETVLFLYTQHNFKWTVVQYSYFNAYCAAITFLGTIILFLIIKKLRCKNEFFLITINCFVKIAINLILVFFREPFYIFIANIGLLLQNISIMALHSICYKIVSKDDLEKLYSLLTLVLLLSKVVFVPIYCIYVYYKTLNVLHTSLFLANIALYVLIGLISVITYFLYKWVLYITEEASEFFVERMAQY